MAKLEIHFSTGLVGHAGLSPERPLVVGTHPQCDVALSEPEVAPVHCRIIWKGDGYWVETAPNADDVELNGRPVRAAPLVSGDSLLFGETRIVVDAAAAAEGVTPGAEQPRGQGGEEGPYQDLWAAMDRGEAVEMGPPVLRPTAPGRWWSRSKAVRDAEGPTDAPPPGQEKLLRSPMILGLSATLLALSMTGLVFWIVFARVGGQRHYDLALEAMREELYAEAARRFGRFLEDYPDHEMVESAQVLRALCRVRRFSDGPSASPSEAVREAAHMVDQMGGLPAFDPVQSQLGEILSRMARALSAQAEGEGDKEAYRRAQQAMRLLEKLGAPPEDDGELQRSLSVARTGIEKADRLEQTLLKMERSLEAGDPLAVYRLHSRLVRRYPELGSEERLGESLRRATELERQDVTWQPGRPVEAEAKPQAAVRTNGAFAARERKRPIQPLAAVASTHAAPDALRYASAAAQDEAALTNEPSTPIAAQMSFVVGSVDRTNRPPAGNAAQPVVFAIADGALYAVDGGNGTVLWRRAVGHDVSFLPTLVPGSGAHRALVSDTLRDELLLVEARTGELVWRQSLGEAWSSAPLVHQGRVFVATRGGHLFVLDLQTGLVQGHLSFPQPLAHAPVPGAGGTRLYAAAQYASLYVLSASSLECDDVLYLGHPTNSIRAKPLSVGEFLIVAENHALHAARLRVLETSSTEGTLRVQSVALEGWVSETPVVSGRFVWVASDAGRLYTFQVSPTRPSGPLALVAQSDRPDESGLPQYLLPWSELECLVAGSELRRWVLSVQRQSLSVGWNDGHRGVPTQELQRHADVLFTARGISGAAGILLTAFDTRTNSPVWEVRLANGLAAVIVQRSTASPIVVTQSGYGFRWDQAATDTRLESKPFLTIGGDWLDASREMTCDADRSAFVLGTGDGGRQLLVWTTRDDRLEPAPHWIELPSVAAAETAVAGQGILVPAADNRLYLLDANTGRQLAIPFQPPIDARNPIRWSNPVVSHSGVIVAADTSGSLIRLEIKHEPFDYLAAVQSRSLDHRIVSPLVLLHARVCFVDSHHNLQVVSADDLSTVAVWQLAGDAPAAGPWAVGDYLVVASQGREMVCLDRNGALLWRKAFEDWRSAGPPLLHRGALCFVEADGTVLAVRPQDGQELWRVDVPEPLTAGFVTPDEKLVVVSDDGTLNTLVVPGPRS